MSGDADVALVAAVIGDQTRASFLRELLGGDSRRASELASAAGVSRATASFHLARLLEVHLIVVQTQGRHRAYRLAGADVARAIESLQRIAPRAEVRSLRAANEAQALNHARFCYDHLAGRLAIELVDGMSARGLMVLESDSFELTERGESWLGELGIDVAGLRARRRSFARACLDWSERRPHVAGAVGAALAGRMLELGWIERTPRGRAVKVTTAGARELYEELGVGARRVAEPASEA